MALVSKVIWRICSAHLIGSNKVGEHDSSSNIPTIFPAKRKSIRVTGNAVVLDYKPYMELRRKKEKLCVINSTSSKIDKVMFIDFQELEIQNEHLIAINIYSVINRHMTLKHELKYLVLWIWLFMDQQFREYFIQI